MMKRPHSLRPYTPLIGGGCKKLSQRPLMAWALTLTVALQHSVN